MKLTISDAAKLLAIPDATIKRWIQQGKIPVMEDRNRYFFIKEDIEKWALNHNIFLHTHFQKNISESPQSEHSLLKAMKQGGVFFDVHGSEGLKPGFLQPKEFTASTLPDIPTHFRFMCCLEALVIFQHVLFGYLPRRRKNRKNITSRYWKITICLIK